MNAKTQPGPNLSPDAPLPGNSNVGDKGVSNGKRVYVGCKLPGGIICELGKVGSETYQRVQLRGAQSSKIIGGYGLTEVNEDFIKPWLKKHSWMDAVKQGLIFVQDSRENAEAYAEDTSSIVTGFERLSPKDAPKGLDVDEVHMKNSQRDLEAFRRAGA